MSICQLTMTPCAARSTPDMYMTSCPALQGHHEHPPFDNDTMRSAYHIRELDVYRLKQLQHPLDIFLSHDWPRGIANHGNLQQLLSRKAFLRAEVRYHHRPVKDSSGRWGASKPVASTPTLAVRRRIAQSSSAVYLYSQPVLTTGLQP